MPTEVEVRCKRRHLATVSCNSIKIPDKILNAKCHSDLNECSLSLMSSTLVVWVYVWGGKKQHGVWKMELWQWKEEENGVTGSPSISTALSWQDLSLHWLDIYVMQGRGGEFSASVLKVNILPFYGSNAFSCLPQDLESQLTCPVKEVCFQESAFRNRRTLIQFHIFVTMKHRYVSEI